jgi:lipoprotein-anchoring transpeptidase ErfK/SrfK
MRSRGVFFAALAASVLVSPAASAGIVVSIDKSIQQMSVSVDGVKRYTWPVSTGRAGYATPSGAYTPFRLEEDHYSKEWDDAPMPHSIFFTPKGHAIHGSFETKRLGTAASHGCVRLAPKNAATLFALVKQEGLATPRSCSPARPHR